MNSRQGLIQKHRAYLVLAVAASIYILYNFAVTSYIVAERVEQSIVLWNIFLAEVIVFIPVGVFFLVVQKLYQQERWLFTSLSLKTIGVHLLLLFLLIVVHAFWQVYFNSLLIGLHFMVEEVARDIMGFLNLRVLIYIISIGLVVGIVNIQEKERSLVKQSELKVQLQKAYFKELELKLNPEIIYPNLEFIKQHVHTKPAEASALILNLSKQLRILIDQLEEERITIKKDLLFFEYYLQALQLRLDKSFRIHKEVDQEYLDKKIASLVLMVPFLEELFFGDYHEYIQNMTDVKYRVLRIKNGVIHIAIDIYPVLGADDLENKLKDNQTFSEVNQLLSAYENSALKAVVDGSCLSIHLAMGGE